MDNITLQNGIIQLSDVLYSDGRKIIVQELNENIRILNEKGDEINSEYNEIKYNWHDILRAQKNANKALLTIIPELINKLENQKKPEGDFEQV